MKTAKHRNTKPFDQINWCEDVRVGNMWSRQRGVTERSRGAPRAGGVTFPPQLQPPTLGGGLWEAANNTRHHVSWVYHKHQTDDSKNTLFVTVTANQEFWPVYYFAIVYYLCFWLESHLCGGIVSDKISAIVQLNIYVHCKLGSI